jgi:serine/threonine protein kinase
LSTTARIAAIDWTSEQFARHHAFAIPARGTEVTLASSFARGGFGAVHAVQSLDGRPPDRPMVVKVFDRTVLDKHGGAATLVANLSGLTTALHAGDDPRWPDALLALPFCIAIIELGSRSEVAALMLDLRALGYGPAQFIEPNTLADYFAHASRDRIDLALRFAERCSLLQQIAFVHGDLNPENLLMNLATLDVQLIDFDAGLIVRSGGERPLTPGKPDDCMPPEVKRRGVGVDPVDLSKYTSAAERWSLGSLVGYLVFGVHPVFFLRTISARAIADYAREPGGWPEIDTGGPLFTDIPQNKRAYELMKHELAALPAGARQLFRSFFKAGLNGELRPTAKEWATALAGLREPPVIEHVTVDQDFVVEGSVVLLSWSTRNASKVEITALGDQPSEGSMAIAVTATTVFTIRAFNAYGVAELSSPVVRVVTLPRLESIVVPEFPGITLNFVYPPELLGAGLLDAGVEADHAAANPLPAPRLARCFAVDECAEFDESVDSLPAAPLVASVFGSAPVLSRILRHRDDTRTRRRT